MFVTVSAVKDGKDCAVQMGFTWMIVLSVAGNFSEKLLATVLDTPFRGSELTIGRCIKNVTQY